MEEAISEGFQKCSKCNEIKPLEQFSFRRCKGCQKEYQKEYDRKRNAKPEIKENKKAYDKEYDAKAETKEKKKQNRAKPENKAKKRERDKEYNLKNKEKRREYNKQYIKERKKNDPTFKLRKTISITIIKMLKNNNGSKNGASILDYLGYTIEQLKLHLESQFEPWMNWSNWSMFRTATWDDNDPTTWTWQLDHIIAQSLLSFSSMEEENFKKCWALENLRPLSAKQNLLDGNRR